MKCRLPMRIGTPSSGTSYPDGAFIPVTKFTAGKSYALVAKIDGVYRYINTEKFNDYTLNATEVSVTPGGGYVTFGSEPALFKAEASGDGFTLSNGDNYLYGYSDQYSTALRYDASSSVWTVDTSETGGFESGKYLPKEVASSVWLKNASGDYEWSIKYESAGSFGYDRAGRDSTYSTGFVSFILYEKYEGGSGGSGGGTPSGTVTLTVTSDNIATGTSGGHVEIDGVTIEKGTSVEIAVGTKVDVYAGGYSMADSRVILDGVEVARGQDEAWPYVYTITKNSTIHYTYVDNAYGVATITTSTSSGGGGGTTEEYSLVINDTNGVLGQYYNVAVDGVFYKESTTLAVKSGTEVKVVSSSPNLPVTVTLDGSTVASFTSGEYSFTMSSNTTITASVNSSYQEVYFTITTEGSSGGGGGTPSEYALSLSGSFHKDYCYITVNNTKYMTAQALAITAGTVVVVTADFIYLNGTQVAKGEPTTYSHTLNSNASIACSTDQTGFYTARITTE